MGVCVFMSIFFLKSIILQKVPYRTMHPDAPIQMWKQKASDKEKVLRVVMLANPNVSVKDEWTKEEEVEEEEEGIGTWSLLNEEAFDS